MLGHGGMSIVYLAAHTRLERKVALKLLSPQLSDDQAFRERFVRESKLAASLDHPNIIPIYEANEADGVFFIAMRYVKGADLRTLLQAGPLDPQRTVAIVDQTANALVAAHAHGLIHRDVKPANILIDHGAGREGADHVYLSDFGVAKQVESPGLTMTGTFVGTADYASPEQIEGKPLDGRADVYSLGCVVYECLTGTSAYDKDSAVALMYAHLLEPPPTVSDSRPDLPPELDEVIARAMAKAPEDRYETPKELASALSRVLGAATAPSAPSAPSGADVAVTVLAPVPSGGAALPETTVAPPPAPQTASQPAATPPAAAAARRPAVLVAAFAAGIVLVGGAVAVVLSLSGDDEGGANVAAATELVATETSAAETEHAGGALLDVLVPTQIASTCTAQDTGSGGAVEADVCSAPEDAPTSYPDELELTFFPDAQTLNSAYAAAKQGATLSPCGSAEGEAVWIHPTTGKTGGRRVCFIDAEGRFAIAWTHVKLDSEDHVDMLAVAREPGRSPAITTWWRSLNGFLGKCRAQVPAHTCIATIEAVTGTS